MEEAPLTWKEIALAVIVAMLMTAAPIILFKLGI